MSLIRRMARHLLSPAWRMRRSFTAATLQDLEQAIGAAESGHAGEIRFVVEHALEPLELWAGLSSRQRALQVFSQLRVWDTEDNNGILVYLLFAERAVEIVADRGIARRVPQPEWDALCSELETLFRASQFRDGSLRAIDGAAVLLRRHFPAGDERGNELPDRPVLL